MPSLEEIRFDPRARAEARQRLQALPESHLAELIEVQKEESRQSNVRLRDQMEDDWRLYQSQANFSDKEDWQSQVWVPMPFTAVEQATSVIRRGMLDSREFFGIDGVDRRDKAIAEHILEPVIRLLYEKAGFVDKFSDATKVGFAVGTSKYLRFRWTTFPAATVAGIEMDPATGQPTPIYRNRPRGFLAIDTVSPWQVYRDPDSKSREQWSGSYFMHEEYVDRAWLLDGAARGLFRNVEKVPEGVEFSGGRQGESATRVATRKQQVWERSKFRKTYLATEWYGDVVDQNGDPVYPDAKMISANGILLHGPEDNPLWAVDPGSGRRKWPYVAFSPIGHPMRFEGKGILEEVTPLATLFSNIFNLYADGLNWTVHPPTEVDMTVLDDWDDLEHMPGKLWVKNQQGNALTPANIGKMEHSAVLASLQYVHQLFQNGSFVTDFVMGLPGTRSNITKGEVQLKTAQSMGMFDGMAREIEAGGRSCVELTLDFILQYLTDFSDPSLLEIVGPENAQLLMMLNPAERMETLGGNYNYVFTGISSSLEKSDLLQRLTGMAQLAGQQPYVGRTNPSDFLRAMAELMGLVDRIPVYDEPMVPMSQVQQMLMRAAAQMQPGAQGAGQRALPAAGRTA